MILAENALDIEAGRANGLSKAMLDRFGVELREGYGLTEAAPTVTTSVGAPPRFGSVGRAIHGRSRPSARRRAPHP